MKLLRIYQMFFVFLSIFILQPIPSALGNLLVNLGGELAEPVLIYSDDKIDVYTDPMSRVIIGTRSDNFAANFYFVFKDESFRKEAIERIKNRQRVVGRSKIDDLKYVVMYFQYFANGRINGVAGYTPSRSGIPLLSIQKTVYNAPVQKGNPFFEEGTEKILSDKVNRENAAYIGTEGGKWNVFAGDLDQPVAAVQLDGRRCPLYDKVVKAFLSKVRSQ